MQGELWAVQNEPPLPAPQAFQLSTKMEAPNRLLISFNIAPGYYLYRSRMQFSFDPAGQFKVAWPAPIKKEVDHRVDEVYAGHLTIPIILADGYQPVRLKVMYQGCSQQGFCYPPTEQFISLDASDQAISPTTPASVSKQMFSLFSSFLTDQNRVQALFGTQHLSLLLLIFIGIGMLLALTPCVLPMIPILASIIVGQQSSGGMRPAFLLSVIYVVGSASTYAVAGVMAAYLGRSLQVWLQQPWVMTMMSGLIVLFALALFGVYELQLPRRWQSRILSLSQKQKAGAYAGVFTMGVLSTLIVSPCVTAPLIGVLMYIAQSGDMVLGGGALFAMGMGMGIPLILMGLSMGKWLPKSGAWMNLLQKILGLVMVAMAAWLLSRAWAMTLPQKTLTQDFTVIRSVSDLDQQLARAQAAGRPVMLDFYADWCESCVSMDKHVFSMTEVKNRLSPFILLRADLSANSKEEQALLNQYAIIAPPTVLLFNAAGKEVPAYRVVGELNAEEFMHRIDSFVAKRCDTNIAC
jgi:thiol:disulfide interchange protein DsbD